MSIQEVSIKEAVNFIHQVNYMSVMKHYHVGMTSSNGSVKIIFKEKQWFYQTFIGKKIRFLFGIDKKFNPKNFQEASLEILGYLRKNKYKEKKDVIKKILYFNNSFCTRHPQKIEKIKKAAKTIWKGATCYIQDANKTSYTANFFYTQRNSSERKLIGDAKHTFALISCCLITAIKGKNKEKLKKLIKKAKQTINAFDKKITQCNEKDAKIEEEWKKEFAKKIDELKKKAEKLQNKLGKERKKHFKQERKNFKEWRRKFDEESRRFEKEWERSRNEWQRSRNERNERFNNERQTYNDDSQPLIYTLEEILGGKITDSKALNSLHKKWMLKNHPDKCQQNKISEEDANKKCQYVNDLIDQLKEKKSWPK
ncbi:MAG: hypothetical protein ACM3JI_04185 [Anaerolineae bacterium]